MKLSILILFFITNELTSKKSNRGKRRNCHYVTGCCPCGHRNQKEINADEACKESKDAHRASNERIVGGCNAGGIIPWYALIVLQIDSQPRCGGALINRLWVLTAAHCFTTTVMARDKLDGSWTLQMPFNDTKQVADIYIGITEYFGATCVTGVSCSQNHEKYHIEELFIHPKYKRVRDLKTYGYERKDYDIALIRLDYPVAGNGKYKSDNIGRNKNFDPKIVMPICLPKRDYKDEERQAMGVGMGMTELKQIDCYTNEKGPDIFTKCARRFRYHNEDSKDDFGEYTKYFEPSEIMPCEKRLSSIPSRKLNPLCKEFRLNYIKTLEEKKKNGTGLSKEEKLKLNLASDEVILLSKENVSHCFHADLPEKSPGWCGTCVANATENTPGYCSAKRDPTIEETAIVYPHKGWGFCDNGCKHGVNPYTSIVKKVKLSTFNDTFCKEIGTRVYAKYLFIKEPQAGPMISNIRVELCVGHLHKLEANSFKHNVKSDDFTVIKNTSSNYGNALNSKRRNDRSDNIGKQRSFRSIRLKNNPNIPNANLAEKGFIMGGEDTCFGDSGGPLYTMDPEGEDIDKITQKATLIGIISRGIGCAQKNYPGIYTRVKKMLGFIYKTMRNSGEKGIHTYKRKSREGDAFTDGGIFKEGEEVEVDPYCARKKKGNRRTGHKKRKKKNKKRRKKRNRKRENKEETI